MINEKEEKKNSTFKYKNSIVNNSQSNNDGGNLEEVQSLLVFDPLSDGLAIKNSLLNNTNSWKSHLKRGERIKPYKRFHCLHSQDNQMLIIGYFQKQYLRNKE